MCYRLTWRKKKKKKNYLVWCSSLAYKRKRYPQRKDEAFNFKFLIIQLLIPTLPRKWQITALLKQTQLLNTTSFRVLSINSSHSCVEWSAKCKLRFERWKLMVFDCDVHWGSSSTVEISSPVVTFLSSLSIKVLPSTGISPFSQVKQLKLWNELFNYGAPTYPNNVGKSRNSLGGKRLAKEWCGFKFYKMALRAPVHKESSLRACDFRQSFPLGVWRKLR